MVHNRKPYCITHRLQVAPSIVSYTLAPCDSPLSVQPGQYVLWHTPNQTIHCSVAEETSTGVLQFHLRENANHALLSSVMPNDICYLEGPFGHCVIQTPIKSPLLFVAGGTGYAPYNRLIPHVLHQQLSVDTYFYWGVQCREDWYAWNALCDLANTYKHFRFIPVLANTNAAWHGRIGLVHEVILEDFASLIDCTVFASGPWPMIQTLSHHFFARGLSSHRLFSDFLPPDEI